MPSHPFTQTAQEQRAWSGSRSSAAQANMINASGTEFLKLECVSGDLVKMLIQIQ